MLSKGIKLMENRAFSYSQVKDCHRNKCYGGTYSADQHFGAYWFFNNLQVFAVMS